MHICPRTTEEAVKIEFKADAKTVKQLEDAFSLLEKKVATKVLRKASVLLVMSQQTT